MAESQRDIVGIGPGALHVTLASGPEAGAWTLYDQGRSVRPGDLPGDGAGALGGEAPSLPSGLAGFALDRRRVAPPSAAHGRAAVLQGVVSPFERARVALGDLPFAAWMPSSPLANDRDLE